MKNIKPLKTITVADQMISLYAEYIEGYIDSSIKKYHYHLENISNNDILEMIIKTHWDSHVMDLYELLVKRIGSTEAQKLAYKDKLAYKIIEKAFTKENQKLQKETEKLLKEKERLLAIARSKEN